MFIRVLPESYGQKLTAAMAKRNLQEALNIAGIPGDIIKQYCLDQAVPTLEHRVTLGIIFEELKTPVADFTFEEYSYIATKTTQYPGRGKEYYYPALKLAGEAGEVCEKFGKNIRDNGGIITEAFRQEQLKELGDVLWYLNELAIFLGSSLAEVAQINNTKLMDRYNRGKLGGSGDNR